MGITSAQSAVGFQHGASASRLDADFARTCVRSAQAASQAVLGEQPQRALADWLLRKLLASGLPAQAHHFVASPRHQQLRGQNGTVRGTNVVAIARAARGDGKETLLLVTPMHGDNTLALGVGLHLMGHLAHAPWLSRDIIWLVPDAGVTGGSYAAVEAWLEEYRGDDALTSRPSGSSQRLADAPFIRSGSISAALAFDFPANGFDELQLQVQGTHGALPNLDVVSVLWHTAAGVPLRVAGLSLRAEGGYSRSWEQYIASLRAGALFLRKQLRGAPDSLHSALLDDYIDSASIVGVRHNAAAPAFRDEHATMAMGRILEAALRSLSNMLERLHHSSAFYVLLSPSRLISAPGFMPQVGILVGALILQACALALNGSKPQWNEPPSTTEWAHGMAVATGVLFACAVSHGMLLRMPRDGAGAPALWAAFTCIACVSGVHAPHMFSSKSTPLRTGEWMPLKALMLVNLALWLARALVECYAVSLAGALMLVPTCLAARPRAPGDSRALTAARWVLLLAASPPVLMCALGVLMHSTSPANTLHLLVDDWQQWGTVLLPFMLGAYLPCFTVCVALLRA